MDFRYLKDPLFVTCLLLFVINRWWLKIVSSNWFLHSYLNDLICIPFWVPIMLFVIRRLGLRKDDSIPHSYEIVIPLIIWAVMFEIVLPGIGPFAGFAVPDPIDIFFYTLGACIAWSFWNCWYRNSVPNTTG